MTKFCLKHPGKKNWSVVFEMLLIFSLTVEQILDLTHAHAPTHYCVAPVTAQRQLLMINNGDKFFKAIYLSIVGRTLSLWI